MAQLRGLDYLQGWIIDLVVIIFPVSLENLALFFFFFVKIPLPEMKKAQDHVPCILSLIIVIIFFHNLQFANSWADCYRDADISEMMSPPCEQA